MKKVYWITRASVLTALITASAVMFWAKSAQANDMRLEAPQTQEIRPALFKNAEKAMAAAQAENALLLAPKSFNEGLRRYIKAETRFEQGDMPVNIYNDLNVAIASFQKSKEDAQVAKIVFFPALKARDDAMKAAAPKFAATTWQKSEEKLLRAARILEEGDLNEAKKIITEVEKQYRQAESEAFQLNPLARTSVAPGKSTAEPSNGTSGNNKELDLLKLRVEVLEQSVSKQTTESNGASNGVSGKNGTSRNGTHAQTPSRPPAPSLSVELFYPLEHLYSPEEGIVLKRGNDLVIRILGLDFVERGGDVEVRRAYQLNRVKDALERFPASKITVERHTYIYGTTQENLKYSRERAAMVKRYLRENLQIRQPIVALGYGNTSPIPSHELTNGHVRNDRIDIIITPRE